MLVTSSETDRLLLRLFDIRHASYRDGKFAHNYFQKHSFKPKKEKANIGTKDASLQAELAALTSIALIANTILYHSLDTLVRVTLTGGQQIVDQHIDTKACWTIQVDDEVRFTKTGSVKAQGGIYITAKRVNQLAVLKSGDRFNLACDDLQRGEGSLIEARGDIDLDVQIMNNSNATLLSTHGAISWRGGQKATLKNCGGRIQAQGSVNLGLSGRPDPNGQLINQGGLILSEQKAVKLLFEFIDNRKGVIKAHDLDFEYRSLNNKNGEIDASHHIDFLIKQKIEIENRAQNRTKCLISELAPGRVISKRGGIYIVSQRPLVIRDNLVSQGLLRVIVDGRITNHPGVELCSQQNDIQLFSNGKKGAIDLQNCQLQGKKIDFGSESSITVENAHGRGDLNFKVIGDLQIRSINFDMEKDGFKIEPSEMGKVEISTSQIKGGSFSLLPSDDALQFKEVLIKESKFELSDFALRARRFQFDHTTINLQQKMTAECDEIFSAHSNIRAQGDCSLKSDQKAIVNDLYTKAQKIVLRSQRGRIEANSVLFWSMSTIAVQAFEKNVFLSGMMRAMGKIRIFAEKILYLDQFLTWTNDDLLFVGNALHLDDTHLIAEGGELTLLGEQRYLAQNSTLIASKGSVTERSMGAISTCKSHAYTAAFKSYGKEIEATQVMIIARDRIDQIARNISHRQALFSVNQTASIDQTNLTCSGLSPKSMIDIRATNQLVTTTSELKAGEISCQANHARLDSTAIRGNHVVLSAPNQLLLNRSSISKFSFESSHPRSRKSDENYISKLILRSADLQVSNSRWHIDNTLIKGGDVKLQNDRGNSRSFHIAADKTSAIYRSSLKSNSILVKSGLGNSLVNSSFDSSMAEFEAQKLTIDQSFTRSDRLRLLSKGQLHLNNTGLITNHSNFDASFIQMSNTDLLVGSSLALKARFVDANRVCLEMREGSADLKMEFAALNDLIAIVGKDCDLRGQALNLLASQFFVGKRFKLLAKEKLKFISSLAIAKHLDLESADSSVIMSYLQARKEMVLQGQKGLWLNSDLAAQTALKAVNDHLDIRGGEQTAKSLQIKAEQLKIVAATQSASKALTLDAVQITIVQAMLSSPDVAIASKALEISKTMIEADDQIFLQSKRQRIAQSSIKTGGLFQQIGEQVVGIGNIIKSQNQIQLASQVIFELQEQRKIGNAFLQLAPHIEKNEVDECAGFFGELALQLQKFQGRQKSESIVSIAADLDVSRMKSSAIKLMYMAGWKIRADQSQLQALELGAISSQATLSFDRSSIWGDRFQARSMTGSLLAGESDWQVKNLFLSAQKELDLTKSNIQTLAFQGRGNFITNQNGDIRGQHLVLAANTRIDNRNGVIQGLFHLSAPLILDQSGMMVPSHGSSKLNTPDLQTDEASLFAGFGDLELNLLNETLQGRFATEGDLSFNLQNSQFRNEASIDADRLTLLALGDVLNRGQIAVRNGSIQTAGDLNNENLIEGQERFSLRVAKLNQGSTASIASENFQLHQRQAIKTSELGAIFGNAQKEMTSDGSISVDAPENTPGSLKLANSARAADVQTQSSVVAGGPVALEGRSIHLRERFHTKGGAQLRSNAEITNQNHMTIAEDLEVSGDLFHNYAGDIEVKGFARAQVKRFHNQSRILEMPLGHRPYRDWDSDHPDAKAYPSQRARFVTEGGWEITPSESFKNEGGEMLTAGDAVHAAAAPHNINLTHEYTHRQFVGDQKKLRPFRIFDSGSIHKRVPIYEKRTQIVVDCAGVLESGQNLILNNLTGDLINEGVISARQIRGRVENLTLKLLNERGRSPNFIEPKTKLPLATMSSELDTRLEVINKTIIQGRLQAGRDLDLLTQDLDIERRRVVEKSALIRKGGFLQSDTARYGETMHIEEGAEVFAGRHSWVRALEMGKLVGAQFKSGGDLQVRARNLNLLSQDEISRVNLPGKSSLFRGRNLHALHRHFNPSTFQAGAFAQISADEHLVNEAAQMASGAGSVLQSHSAEHRVLTAVNQVRSDRSAFRSADQHQAEMIAPLISSTNGHAGVQTAQDLLFPGRIIAGPDHSAFAASSEGSVDLPTHSQKWIQRESKTRCHFMSVSATKEESEESEISPCVMAGGNVVISAQNEIRGEGVQFDAIKTIAMKAKKISLEPHQQTKRIRKNGATLGVSFSGFSIIENLAKGQSLDEVVKSALLSDPALGQTYALIKAKTGHERAYRSLKAAVSYWQTANTYSLSSTQGQPLHTFIGQRANILNQQGQLAPKTSVGLELFEDVQETSDLFLCQLTAGEQIIVEAAEQDYRGTLLSADLVALTGDHGQKAKRISLQSALSTIYQTRDTLSLGLDFQTGAGASNCPPDVSLTIAQSDFSQSTNLNSRINARHLHLMSEEVGVKGANIYAETASGLADQLVLKSRLDESESNHERASISTSGQLSISKKAKLEGRVAHPSCIIVDRPSALQVGHLDNTAGVVENVKASVTNYCHLEETRKERGFGISANLNYAGQILRRGNPNQSGKEAKKDGPNSDEKIAQIFQDPRSRQAITEIGTWEWEHLDERNEARATGLGTSSQKGLNDDLNKYRGPISRNYSQGGIPILSVDQRLLRDQASLVFAPSARSITEPLTQEIKATEAEKERLATNVRELRSRANADDHDVIANICKEITNISEKITDEAGLGIGEQTPLAAEQGNAYLLKEIRDLNWLRDQLVLARDHLRAQEEQLSNNHISDEERDTKLRPAQIALDQALVNHLKRRSKLNRDLYRTADRNYGENAESVVSDKWISIRDRLCDEQEKIDNELMTIGMNARFVQMEIDEKIDRRLLSSEKGQISDDMKAESERYLQEIYCLESMQKSIEQEHLLAYQRSLIKDAFKEVNTDSKDDLIAHALFNLPQFADLYCRARRAQVSEKFKDRPSAVAKLAKEAGVCQDAADAIWQIAGSVRGGIFERELSRVDLRQKEIDATTTFIESYEIEKDKAIDLKDHIKPLPVWVKEAEAYAHELNSNPFFEISEKKSLMHKKMHELFARKSDEQCSLDPSQVFFINHFEDQVVSGVNTKASDQITGLTSKNYVYLGDFEKTRHNPSGNIYFASDKSAREARNEYRLPSNLKVMFMGGMMNYDPAGYAPFVKLISDTYGGKAVKSIYNSCQDFKTDLGEVIKGRHQDMMTMPVMLAVKSIKEDLSASSDGAIHILAHSQACIHLANALKHFKVEEIERLRVTFIAPGKPISDLECKNSVNLVRWNDIVVWLGSNFNLIDKGNVKFLKGHESGKWYIPDHSLMSLSYREAIQEQCREYSKALGVENEQQHRKQIQKLFDLTNGKRNWRV